MKLKKYFKKLYLLWDIRSNVSKIWRENSQKYEGDLRGNISLDPKIVESVLEEKNRILTLFQTLLPEYENQISIVVTNNVFQETLAISTWDNHIYIIVSAALIARPIDNPHSNGINGWNFLALHEIAHIKSGHLPLLFHVRRVFQFSNLLIFLLSFIFFGFCLFAPLTYLMMPNFSIFYKLYGIIWFIQTAISLTFECSADIQAARSIKDPLFLEDAVNTLDRMKDLTIKSIGLLKYIAICLLVDAHPPFILRKWILLKYAKLLRKNLASQ
jgi:hypothetical protein